MVLIALNPGKDDGNDEKPPFRHCVDACRARPQSYPRPAEAVAEARILIQQKKARHLLALSRNDLERRHEKAVREIMERYAGITQPAAAPPEPAAAVLQQAKLPQAKLPEVKPVPRRRAKSRQHAEALSG